MKTEFCKTYTAGHIDYEIVEHYGVIAPIDKNGWKKELNLVAWNGGSPKLDIRNWDPEHTHMSRGSTFTEEEFKELITVGKGVFK